MITTIKWLLTLRPQKLVIALFSLAIGGLIYDRGEKIEEINNLQKLIIIERKQGKVDLEEERKISRNDLLDCQAESKQKDADATKRLDEIIEQLRTELGRGKQIEVKRNQITNLNVATVKKLATVQRLKNGNK